MKTPIQQIHEANKTRIKAAMERADQRRRQANLDLTRTPSSPFTPERMIALCSIGLAVTICFALYWFLATHFSQ